MRFMTSLRFIDAVAQEKSIRKAAEKLAITSTALNRRILQIEEEIGQPLFCLLYTSPSPRDGLLSRMPSSA